MSVPGVDTGSPADLKRRLWLAILVLGLILAIYTLVYRWAMAVYSDQEVSLVHSLRIVIESLTTAGFGGDTDHWENTPMHVLVILMNLTGVALVFLALPLFVVPLFSQVFKSAPPMTTSLTDHVIICGYSPQDEVLRKELDVVDIDHVYIDPDADLVSELTAHDIDAIVGDPERVEVLESANASEARAIVADIDDETNPTVILSAKQLNPSLQSISVIRNYEVEPYHRFAGADHVVLARQLLGKSFGMRAAASHAEKLREVIEVESKLEITELLVDRNSGLVGQTFREATIFDEMGITVIGMWVGGKFIVAPDPDAQITENAILLAAGERDDFEAVTARSIPHPEDEPPRVVICGYGTVGWSVAQTLEEEGIETEIIDIEDKPGVDIVGDVTDPETLREARVDDARAVVLTLDKDTPTIYASLVINELAPDVEIIARADEPDTVWKLYNAGADFVLSLSTITGEILASHLIDEADILTPDTDFGFGRIEATSFEGESLKELDLRAKYGCTVIAVERNGSLLTDLGGDFVIESGDCLIVAGRNEHRSRLSDVA